MAECPICNGTQIIKKGDIFTPCSCVLRNRFRKAYGAFIPCDKIEPTLSQHFIDSISDRDHILAPKLLIQPNKSYKSYIINYLLKLYGLNPSVSVYKSYELIDMMLHPTDDVDLYSLPGKTLVFLYGFASMPNKQEVNLLKQLIDHYSTKRVIVYMEAISQELYSYLKENKFTIYSPSTQTRKSHVSNNFDGF